MHLLYLGPQPPHQHLGLHVNLLPEQMFDSDFFRLFGADFTGHVFERLRRRGTILYKLRRIE